MKTKEELKNWIILILVAAISFWGINNINIFISVITKLIKVLSPFIIGIALAYILNIPMIKIEKIINTKLKEKTKKIPVRIISITLSILLLILILAVVLLMLIPELIENIELLIQNIPTLITNVENWIIGLLDKYPDMQYEIKKVFAENATVNSIIVNILNYILNGSINLISSLVSGIFTVFTALIFAIYMLSQKERIQTSLKELIYAYIKKEYANKIMYISKLSNNIFTKFISGQCVEAVILGCILFVVLTIFRLPYALLISVLTSITALIPIFGALIAMVIGIILIAITNPFQAFIFALIFLVIQQIEGNLIYPKVVGKSVGLSPIWTLLAITVGGGLFGIIGMLIGLPIASIMYSLFKNNKNERIVKKKRKQEKESSL